MKKADNKSTAKMKNMLVLILATVVVIGLMSSTAVRLVTATHLMQISRNNGTGNKVIDMYVDRVTNKNDGSNDQNTNDGSNNQDGAGDNAGDVNTGDTNNNAGGDTSTDGSGDSNVSGDNSSGDTSSDDNSSDDTSSDDSSSDSGSGDALSGILDMFGSLLGGLGGDGDDSSEDVTLSDEEILAINKSALKSYSDVLVKNKTAVKPGFTKTTERSLSLKGIAAAMYSDVKSEEAVAEYLAGETVTVAKGSATDELCLENLYKACVIATDDATVENAVESASKVNIKMVYIKNNETGEIVHGYDKYADGVDYKFDYNEDDYTYAYEVDAVKVVIEFKDEVNPTPIDANGKTDSFIASVFPVVTGKQVLDAIYKAGATTADITYRDCSVELYYNQQNAKIYSLTQNINYDISVKDGYLTMNGTVSEVNKYNGFVY